MATRAHVNFFAGLPLNRLAWLRKSPVFLNATIESPSTRWVLFNNGQPLMVSHSIPNTASPTKNFSLARLTTHDVRSLLGSKPYFAQGEKAGDNAPTSGAPILESSRLHGPPIVFLGLEEPDEPKFPSHQLDTVLPTSEFGAHADPAIVAEKIEGLGTPFFSLDVSKVGKEEVEDALVKALSASTDQPKKGEKLEFVDGRVAMGHLNQIDSGIFSEARTMVDWNSRIKFCASCGSSLHSLWGGWKRACSSLLPWIEQKSGEEVCATATGLHNIAFPRSDPVVIALVVSKKRDKILLGRNKQWPPKFYSALAGFVEPGESLEDTFERELWEEAAVKVWGLQFHSSQPWPFPANIMSGFYAVADPDAPIRLDLDNELEDAKWFTKEEIRQVLEHTAEGPEPPIKLPPRNAMAGVLITDWLYDRVVIGEGSALFASATDKDGVVGDGSAKPFKNFF
ncbi:NUDIX hydrolase domain-like protein [Abortiporus biennis]|nr:NUDIX hydrolase domain-like protein [Abortiporus biennis]